MKYLNKFNESNKLDIDKVYDIIRDHLTELLLDGEFGSDCSKEDPDNPTYYYDKETNDFELVQVEK